MKLLMEWGVKHEADGIANWLIHCSGGKYPQYVLNEQKDFLLENVFNLDDQPSRNESSGCLGSRRLIRKFTKFTGLRIYRIRIDLIRAAI